MKLFVSLSIAGLLLCMGQSVDHSATDVPGGNAVVLADASCVELVDPDTTQSCLRDDEIWLDINEFGPADA